MSKSRSQILKRVVFTCILFGLTGSFLFLVGIKFLQLLEYKTAIRAFMELPDYGDTVKFDLQREGGQMLPSLNLVIKGEKRGDIARVITNSKGFRNDREFSYMVPEKTFRILFSGDSFVDGLRMAQHKTIGYRLEEMLKPLLEGTPYQKTEVLIAGNNNPTLAWYHYQEHGQKYHPQLTILGVTLGNDITWHHYQSGVRPTIEGSHPVKLELTPDFHPTLFGNLMLPPEAYLPKRPIREFLVAKEFAFRSYLAQQSSLFSYSVPPMFKGQDTAEDRQLPAAGFFLSLGLFYQPLLPEMEQQFQNFESALAGFKSAAEYSGSRLLVVLFPVRIQVVKKDWDLLTKANSLDPDAFDLDYPNRRIAEFCEANNIEYLDLLPLFRHQIYDLHYRSPLYQPSGDMHFSRSGNKIAAEALSEKVSSLLK